jgi:hypothetical protein
VGENPAETVKQIEATRARLDRRLDELESRLPGRTTFRRVLRLALGGGVGGAIFWMAVRRLKRGRRERAGAVALPPPPPVEVRVVPERWERAVATEQAKAFAVALATAWLGMKLLSLRRPAER